MRLRTLIWVCALLTIGFALGTRDRELALDCPRKAPPQKPAMIADDYELAIARLERSHPIPYRASVCQAGRCAYYTGPK